MKQEEQKPNKKFYKKWWFWLIVIIVLAIIGSGGNDSNNSQNKTVVNEPPKIEEEQSATELQAYIMSQSFIKPLLKSPSTADFSNYNYTANDLGDNKWLVASSVDSQNSFGAMLRTMYSVIITYNGDDWAEKSNWTLNELMIDDEIIYQEDAE
ncbi:hypothetical protein K8R42_02615 [bacterium]|nr:hypothetical protein [bacterium]